MAHSNVDATVQMEIDIEPVETVEAILTKADLCYEGDGLPNHKVRAAELYRKAADMGSADGMRSYAWCLANGFGTAKSEASAVQWYEKAAALGHVQAMESLGFALYMGYGVNPDKNRAFELLSLAASKGACEAKILLAKWFYLSGTVVPRDIERAIALLNDVETQERDADAKNRARMFLQAIAASGLTFWLRGFRHTYTYQQGVYTTVGGGVAGGGTGVGGYTNAGFQIKVENSSSYPAQYWIKGEIVHKKTNEVTRRFHVTVPDLQPSQNGTEGVELFHNEHLTSIIKIDSIKVSLSNAYSVEWNPNLVVNEAKSKSKSGSGKTVFVLLMMGLIVGTAYFALAKIGVKDTVKETTESVSHEDRDSTQKIGTGAAINKTRKAVATSIHNFDGTWLCKSSVPEPTGDPITISGTEVRQGATRYSLKAGYGLAERENFVDHFIASANESVKLHAVEMVQMPGHMGMYTPGKNSGAGAGVEFHRIDSQTLEAVMYPTIEKAGVSQKLLYSCSSQ